MTQDVLQQRIVVADQTVASRLGVLDALARQGLRNVVVASDEMVADEAALMEHVDDARVIVMGHSPITRNLLARAASLKLVLKAGIGAETIDLDAAADFRVVVACTPGVNVNGVAEYTIGALIMLSRRLAEVDQGLRDGRWREVRERYAGELAELSGRVMGVIGYGGIGSRVAEVAHALGMRVLVFDPNRDLPDRPSPTARRSSLEDLLQTADFVSVNAILTEKARGLIGAEQIALMQEHTIVVQTSRGGIVDTGAIAAALQEGRLGGAVVDVFDVEPVPRDEPLLAAPNTILTPHLSGSTRDGYLAIGRAAAQLVADFVAGTPLSEANVIVA